MKTQLSSETSLEDFERFYDLAREHPLANKKWNGKGVILAAYRLLASKAYSEGKNTFEVSYKSLDRFSIKMEKELLAIEGYTYIVYASRLWGLGNQAYLFLEED